MWETPHNHEQSPEEKQIQITTTTVVDWLTGNHRLVIGDGPTISRLLSL